ncbi:MAG TPA: hypothetical protein VGB37_07305 [Candidatus Lokiarchaeia archaeon]
MKILIATDLHIKESNFEELELVFNEIYQLSIYHQIEEFWLLGDSFDKITPTIKEIDFFSNFLKQFKDKFVRIVAAPSHESKSVEETYLTHFGILVDNIQVAPEFKINLGKNKIYLGHFMCQESLCGFKEEKTIKDYEEYDLTLLGHQHSWQQIAKNAYHLGSCSYVNFNEVKDDNKYIAILNDNKGLQIDFIKLQTPYPMKVVDFAFKSPIAQSNLSLGNDTKLLKKSKSPSQETQKSSKKSTISDALKELDNIDPKTKVKVILRSFQDLADYLPFEEIYKKKFYGYKRDNKFESVSNNLAITKQDNLSMRQYLKEWLSKQKINEAVKKILEDVING